MATLNIENINEECIKNYESISLAEKQKINQLIEDFLIKKCVIKRRQPPASISGKGKIIGDLIEPSVAIEDIECLK
jgi:hypothetical protein